MSAKKAASRPKKSADSTAPGVDPRLHVMNAHDARSDGAYVLYWCRAYRRATDNLALEHAIARADALGLPVLVYEALDVRYPYASDRMHRFVLEGACEMQAALEARGIGYAFYLPRTKTEAHASRAVAKLAEHAALVVTDWYPDAGGEHSLWAHTAKLAARITCRFEAYDDAVVVPMSLLAKSEIAARTIRPKVTREIDRFLALAPDREPKHAMRKLPALPFEPATLTIDALDELIASCAIDHTVEPVASRPGGMREASRRLKKFAQRAIRHYATERNDMARIATSGLSPYIHFGHVSARAAALAVRDEGGEGAEAFLEELIVRRSLAFNYVMTNSRHAHYDGIPEWARDQLAQHADDPRPAATSYAHWLDATTDDVLWNAAQRELLIEGIIHPYARMLWGKVGITLAEKPATAFAWLVELNDRFALDGRDPNTYANIAWCFGQHDHPFPGRAIYGTVRSMTSRSAAQKWDVSAYLARLGMPSDAMEKKRDGEAPAKKKARAFDEFDQRVPDDD